MGVFLEKKRDGYRYSKTLLFNRIVIGFINLFYQVKHLINSAIYFLAFMREGCLVIIYFMNSVIVYFLTCSVKNPEKVICFCFLENSTFLSLGTLAVTLFLLQTGPAPHQRSKKLCGPHKKKVWGPLI